MPRRDIGQELLGYAEIAALAGVEAATLRKYRQQGYLPEPDELVAPDRPRWKRSTVEAWLDSRPGRGAPGRPRSGNPRSPR